MGLPRAALASGRWVPAGVAATVVAGVVLRFLPVRALWLDEAQSVAIARLPLHALFAALRQDGSPPLYYLLLHGWISLVGPGDEAVRALSGIFAVAALPLAWLFGRRVAGRRGAWILLVLTATNPWALRYATETRMYSLVEFLVLATALALVAVHDSPKAWPVVALAAGVGALLATHYWSFFLVAVVTLALAVRAWRGPRREASRRALVGIALGALTFAPWVPSFLYQQAHTGTPWAQVPGVRAITGMVVAWAGGNGGASVLLSVVYWGLAVLGYGGVRAAADRSPTLLAVDVRGAGPGRRLFAVTAATLGLAYLASATAGGAFEVRYTAVVVPLFLACCTLGIRAVPRRAHVPLVAVMVVLGLVGGVAAETARRTQAPAVATVLDAEARPGDVVVFCPDQLGPAVARLTSVGRQVAYPTLGGSGRVDWVDYATRNKQADPVAIARRLDTMAGPGNAIWLVWNNGYRTFGVQCFDLAEALAKTRTRQHQLSSSAPSFEKESLERYSRP